MNTTTRTRPRRPLRRAIASLTIAAGIVAGSVLAAAPAQAVPYGNVGACFTEHFFGAKAPMKSRVVYLEAIVGGYWQRVSTYTTDMRGCISSIPVVAGYTWRFRADVWYGTYYYGGITRQATVRAGYFYDLGPANVLVTKKGL